MAKRPKSRQKDERSADLEFWLKDGSLLPYRARRAFIVHGSEVSASDIYRWCRRWQAPKLGRLERWSIVRILDVIAERAGRATTIGRPWIWRLRNLHLPADATQTVEIAENNQDAG
jgi:hypothetical protein